MVARLAGGSQIGTDTSNALEDRKKRKLHRRSYTLPATLAPEVQVWTGLGHGSAFFKQQSPDNAGAPRMTHTFGARHHRQRLHTSAGLILEMDTAFPPTKRIHRHLPFVAEVYGRKGWVGTLASTYPCFAYLVTVAKLLAANGAKIFKMVGDAVVIATHVCVVHHAGHRNICRCRCHT